MILEPIAFGAFVFLIIMWGTDAILELVSAMIRWMGGE